MSFELVRHALVVVGVDIVYKNVLAFCRSFCILGQLCRRDRPAGKHGIQDSNLFEPFSRSNNGQNQLTERLGKLA